MALCADLLVIAPDARIGYPPARAWGFRPLRCGPTGWVPSVPSGCCSRATSSTGAEAHGWGLAIDAPPPAEVDARFEALLERVALTPVDQLVMMKLLVNQALYAQGLHATELGRHPSRRHGAPYPGWLRLPAPSGRGGLARGGARARRALRLADAYRGGPLDGGRALGTRPGRVESSGPSWVAGPDRTPRPGGRR
jgi:hypothetical protein